MATKTKVLEISECIHLVCIRHNSEPVNPYRLYLLYPAKDRYGYPTEHRKELIRYADFPSVLYHIKDMLTENNLYRSPDAILAWNKRYCGNG